MEPLPPHAGHNLIAAVLAERGDYKQAIEICDYTQLLGWPGDWAAQIQCLLKRQGYPVTYISSGGITPI